MRTRQRIRQEAADRDSDVRLKNVRVCALQPFRNISPGSRGDVTIELRQCCRFVPQYEVIVTLVSDEGCVLTGSLADLSRSGLAFHYMFRRKCRIPKGTLCGVMLKIGSEPSTDPIFCEVVYETSSWPGARLAFPMKRCGVKFKRELSVPAVEALFSV